MLIKILLALALTTSAYAQHEHHPIEIGGVVSLAPKVTVDIVADPHTIGAYNLSLTVQAFRFAPDHVNGSHQYVDMESGPIVEGHAHLFVNGVKVTRLYGAHFFLQNVKKDDVVTVQLNSNDHRLFVLNGISVGSGEAVVPAPAEAEHH